MCRWNARSTGSGLCSEPLSLMKLVPELMDVSGGLRSSVQTCPQILKYLNASNQMPKTISTPQSYLVRCHAKQHLRFARGNIADSWTSSIGEVMENQVSCKQKGIRRSVSCKQNAFAHCHPSDVAQSTPKRPLESTSSNRSWTALSSPAHEATSR